MPDAGVLLLGVLGGLFVFEGGVLFPGSFFVDTEKVQAERVALIWGRDESVIIEDHTGTGARKASKNDVMVEFEVSRGEVFAVLGGAYGEREGRTRQGR